MAITTFIPELWNARLLYALEKNHVATNVVNRNYEGEIKNAGDTVHINTLGAVAVRSYAQGTDLTYDALSTTDQTLVIDQQKYFAFALDDVDKAQAAGDIMDVAMGRAAYSLADVSDAFLYIFGRDHSFQRTIGNIKPAVIFHCHIPVLRIIRVAILLLRKLDRRVWQRSEFL